MHYKVIIFPLRILNRLIGITLCPKNGTERRAMARVPVGQTRNLSILALQIRQMNMTVRKQGLKNSKN